MKISAYAALGEKQPLQKFEYEAPPLGPMDVEVRITHCGICHSDIHLIDNDWQMSTYPLVPGHEIIGVVTEIGSEVKHLEKGQRVGIGWQRSSCLICDHCLRGEENLCPESEDTCLGHYGGFAEYIRTDSRFVFKIPETMDSAQAAPLLCGGITVYSPLKRYGVTPNMKVGVIGIGGLGHLALQFARAFGCEVTAFSTSPEKEVEARALGAHHFIVTSNRKALEQAKNSLDFIVSTVYASIDWQGFVEVLRPNGKICVVGASAEPISLPPVFLLMGQKTIGGSVIGGRAMIREMLEFAARHNIVAQAEIFPMSRVNDAIEKVRQGKARYRVVLQNE